MTVMVVDYGMGNLRSVTQALLALGADARVARGPSALREADRIVLPGVGAFGDGIANLRTGGWVEALEEEVLRKGKPFLGICLGMQLLAARGTEHGVREGLGWIDAEAVRLPLAGADLRLPHVGWNDVRPAEGSRLYRGLPASPVFYFVHGYVLRPAEPGLVSGWCAYGTEFCASVERKNLFATQYHPEKSQKAGLAVLRNFLEADAGC